MPEAAENQEIDCTHSLKDKLMDWSLRVGVSCAGITAMTFAEKYSGSLNSDLMLANVTLGFGIALGLAQGIFVNTKNNNERP